MLSSPATFLPRTTEQYLLYHERYTGVVVHYVQQWLLSALAIYGDYYCVI